MKKTGFTLQEILISLAVIGVIAALTLPALSLQYNKKTWAAGLSAAVSNIETAMSTMIIKDGANDLFGTKAWKVLGGGILTDEGGPIEEFMNAVSETYPLVSYYHNSEAFMDNDNSGYKDGINSVLSKTRKDMYELPVLGESVIFTTKNGMMLFVSIENSDKDPDAISEKDAMDAGVELTSTAARIAIDINGDKQPNTIGRDIFFFILGSDGVLYPYGSNDANNKLGEEYTCENNSGMGCTATLIQNGYVMNY